MVAPRYSVGQRVRVIAAPPRTWAGLIVEVHSFDPGGESCGSSYPPFYVLRRGTSFASHAAFAEDEIAPILPAPSEDLP